MTTGILYPGVREGLMRDGIFIVDGDGHVMDFPHRCYQKYLPEQYRRRSAFFPGAQWDRRQAPNGDMGRDPNTPREMMDDMAQEGIDLAFLYPTSALRIGEIREVDYQTALCRAYNDFIADWCKADPQRLKGVAIAPYLDPTEAARELDRAVSRLGLVGLMFPTFIPGRNVADPFFWPIYEEAERLGVPVGLHASGSETGDPYRFSNFLAVHTWTHAPEQMISVISCVYGGLFEKFQRLRIGFMESGAGWVPVFMEHMDGEVEKRPWDAPLCKAKPNEYMTCRRAHMSGLGELASQMTRHPEPKAIPYMWKASLIESLVSEAGEAVPVGEERRALQLFNPGLDGRWATTNTMIAAIQLLLPGEVARAHRHTPTAIRFIMEGSGGYTAVDGERVYMAPEP